jgi:hypothetical protein
MNRPFAAALYAIVFAFPVLAHDFDATNREADDSSRLELQRKMLRLSLSPEDTNAFLSILIKDRVWSEPNATVCFGPRDVVPTRGPLIKRIMQVADEWTTEIPFKFDWGQPAPRLCESSETARIRVSVKPLNPPIFNSKIGNDTLHGFTAPDIAGFTLALTFPLDNPTFEEEEVFRFYVLHEFGHALGFEHEHQRVDCKFDWKYVARHMGFRSEAEARNNLQQMLGMKSNGYPNMQRERDFITTQVDRYSVMQYNFRTANSPVPDDPSVFSDRDKSPCFRRGWVSKLTKFDREGARKAYSNPGLALSRLRDELSLFTTTISIDSGADKRLSDPRLGRGTSLTVDASKSFRPELDLNISRLKRNPAAVKLLKEILAERHQRSMGRNN